MKLGDSDFKTDFGWFFPLPIRIVFGAVIIVCIGTLVSGGPGFFNLGLMPVAIYIILARNTLHIEFITKRYKEGNEILGISFSNWKDLPELEYVSLFRAQMAQNLASRSSQTTVYDEKFQVNLVHNRNRRLNVLELNNKEIALDIAKYFSMKLKLKILDATTRDFVWIEGYPE